MYFLALKMDFILSEAEENTPNVHFSDEDIKEDNDNSDFIDNPPREQESSFYRELTNLEHYPKFANQTRYPIEATYEEQDYFGEDSQPELYEPKIEIVSSLTGLTNLSKTFTLLKDLCSNLTM